MGFVLQAGFDKKKKKILTVYLNEICIFKKSNIFLCIQHDKMFKPEFGSKLYKVWGEVEINWQNIKMDLCIHLMLIKIQ